MRVLGLDPGLTCAGWGVVETTPKDLVMIDCGVIRTHGETPARLSELHQRCLEIIQLHQPDEVSVERVLFNRNVRTAMPVGQAAGVALLAAQNAGCKIGQYTPSEMKLAVTGYGAADKAQIQFMVAKLLSLAIAPKPADAADALGLAICHIHAHKLKSLANA